MPSSALLLLALTVMAVSALAQSDVRFERITVENGLSQSAITSMVQDKYGYLWIGTLDGLNRYDGNTFTIYRYAENDPNSLPAQSITDLILDPQERIWVTYRNGISLYDPVNNNFKNFRIKVGEENLFVRDLKLVSDTLAILLTNQGILNFNLTNGTTGESTEFSQFKNQNTFDIFRVNSLESWLITDNTLWRKKGDKEWSEFYRSEHRLAAIYSKKSDELYVRTYNQLLKYDRIKDQLTILFDFPIIKWVNSTNLLKTSENHLWVGHGGVYVFDERDQLVKTLNHVAQDPNSLSGPYVSEIYQTRDGVVWVGTNGLGLNKYNPYRSVFGYIGNFPGAPLTLSDHYVSSVFTEDDRTIIVGTLGGVDVIDLAKAKSYHYPVAGKDGNNAMILKIFPGDGGRIWLATNKGLMSLDNNGVGPSGIENLDYPDLVVYDAVEVSPFTFLLATSKNIVRWNEKTREAIELSNTGSVVIASLKGDIWVELADQVNVLKPDFQATKRIFPENGSDTLRAPPASIKCFFQDTDGGIWIGTGGGGMSLYDSISQTFENFKETNGLPNNVVYGILEDNEDNLWLSTNKGLCVFDRKNKRIIRNFYVTDGLQGNEFNTRAYFKSKSGKMYFGGINGLSFFDPAAALRIPSFTPKTVITGFYVNNIRRDHSDTNILTGGANEPEIKLNWDERNFGFDVAGLGFAFPSGIQYQYMLENFEKGWSYIGNQTRITFTNVPPGKYTLRVKSGNSFGDWEENGISVKIIVMAPFWRSPWFVYGSVALVLLAIYLFYVRRTVLLKKRAILLQNLVEERTQEVQRQQVEIAARNEELKVQAETLESQNIELEKVKESLERRVDERTKTLQRLNADLINQNTQLEQFTFITAHNFRGPIARIKGLIHLLSLGKDEEILSHLLSSVNNLDEVIADLSVVLNIKHGIHKSMELIAVKEQLLLAIETLQVDIASVGATIDLTGFEDVNVFGVKPYFQSIFYNLLHNALKYSDNQNRLLIKCTSKQDQDGRVRIEIIDNGIGIDMRYAREKIFHLYQRFHPQVRGKGYGLFLVKTQVEAMRGTIEVESELGSGTKFIMEFPGNNLPPYNHEELA